MLLLNINERHVVLAFGDQVLKQQLFPCQLYFGNLIFLQLGESEGGGRLVNRGVAFGIHDPRGVSQELVQLFLDEPYLTALDLRFGGCAELL